MEVRKNDPSPRRARFRAGLALGLLAAFAGAPAAHAGEYKLLSQLDWSNGEAPSGGVVADPEGDLFGLTSYGGEFGGGTVYQVPPKGPAQLVYSFPVAYVDSPHAAVGKLVRLGSGKLVGVTQVGGDNFVCGTIFEISPNTPPLTAQIKTLYSFQAKGGDGCVPAAGLLNLGGILWGTTVYGGAYGGPDQFGNAVGGTVFYLLPDGGEWTMHSFGHGKDGVTPSSGLIADKKGNLYGETCAGGAYGYGTVYRIGAGFSGTEKVLYSFTGKADGACPTGGLVRDDYGNLYGTAPLGGLPCPNGYPDANGCGTVFRISADGAEKTLHSFTYAQDGAGPSNGLTIDAAGNLFGTTGSGGKFADGRLAGTLFEISQTGKFTVLHAFGNGNDGRFPAGGLTLDKSGKLYGTTSIGGKYDFGDGTVFEYAP